MRKPLPSEAAWEEGLGCPARSSCLLHNQVNWSQTLKTKACDPSKGCCPFLRFSIVLPTMSAFVLSRFSCLTLCDPVDCSSPGSCVHGFSRQEHWSGLPCSPPGDLPDPGIEPVSPVTPALQADSLLMSHQGSPMELLRGLNEALSSWVLLLSRDQRWEGWRHVSPFSFEKGPGLWNLESETVRGGRACP